MSDDIWKRDEVASPCVKVCVVHPEARICIGCYRTTQEIAAWGRMSDDERLALKKDLPGRSTMLSKRAGGRRGRIKRAN